MSRVNIKITFSFDSDGLGGEELNEMLDTREYKSKKFFDELLEDMRDYRLERVYEE